MKRFFIILLPMLMVFTACEEAVDDGGLRKDVTDLQGRVAVLESKINDINTDILSLQALVQSIQAGKQIVSVEQVTKDGETYWELQFSDKTVITLRNGKDGANGKDGKDGANGQDGKDGTNGQDGKDGKDGADGHSPQIGVRQFTDGLWYWTLDGEWLLDGNGNKVRATGIDGKDGQDGQDGANGQDGTNGTNGTDGKDGKDGVTPRLKIEDGFWWVSYDNGTNWEKLTAYSEAGSGDSLISDIDTANDRYITITLSDGQTLVIPRWIALTISFDKEEILLGAPGLTFDVHYTLTGGTASNVVKAIGQGGWIASATPTDAHSGVITLTAPDPVVSCEVVVFASDGEGYTVLASLDCVKGEIIFAEEFVEAPAIGGEIAIPVRTNLASYSVSSTAGWIRYVETRAAFRDESVYVSVDANDSYSDRFGYVLFKQDGAEVMRVLLVQAGMVAPEAFGIWPKTGTGYEYDCAKAHMNLYSAAGKAWFRFIEPSTLSAWEVGPLPETPVVGNSFAATYSKIVAGKVSASEEMTLQVRSYEQEKLILSTADETFFIIRF